MVTTIGKIILKHYLPESFHKFIDTTILDKKGITKLFDDLAKEYPDQYGSIVSGLTREGFEIATREGSSLGLEDLLSGVDKHKEFEGLKIKIKELEDKKLVKSDHDEKLFDLHDVFAKDMEKKIIQHGVENNKTLAKIVVAGSRGSPTQYRATVGLMGIVPDSKGRPILDMPILNSFAEGLSLPEYLNSTYQARNGEILKKISISDSGFLCFSANTLVRMSDFSEKKISDIKIGEFVLGSDKNRKTFPVKVLNVFDNGLQKVNEYKFRVGKQRKNFETIVATPNHNVFAIRNKKGFKKAQLTAELWPLSKVKNGFQICIAENNKDWKFEKQNVKGLMLGLLLGDGDVTGHSVNFSSADLGLIKYLNSILKDENMHLKKIRTRPNDYEYILSQIIRTPYEREKDGTVVVGSFQNPYRQWLSEIGLLGKYTIDKEISFDKIDNSLDFLSSVVAGLIETDGCIARSNNSNVPNILFSNTAKKMVYQLRDILWYRFGVFGNIEHIPKEKFQKNITEKSLCKNVNYDLYTLKIGDRASVLRFAEAIKLPGVKGPRLEKYILEMSSEDRYDGFGFNYISNIVAGEQEVYDIEVDHPDHMYVLANGMIVSNSKQLSRSSFTTKVEEHDCQTNNGVPMPTSDKESVGCFLAQNVGKFLRNNEITTAMLAELQAKNIDKMVVRSPITCQSSRHFHFGALCQMCVGKREKGFPQIGDFIGSVASATASEPTSQAAMVQRHNIGASKGSFLGGFNLINQLLNIPKTFKDKAPSAKEHGIITEIKDSSGGGKFIYVNKKEHFVPTGFSPLVKVGDKVEAGDVLSEGIVDPRDVLQHKGIGEARRYFTNNMYKVYKDNNLPVARRNFEILSKAMIDHVKITDSEGYGEHPPGQIVSYQAMEKDYKPRKTAEEVTPDLGYDKYLEVPVLHYTIGTKLSKKMIEEIKEHGIKSITVHSEPPPFEPVMVRLLDLPETIPDFAHQLYSTYLEKRLVKALATGFGAKSSLKGPSPIMSIAQGIAIGYK